MARCIATSRHRNLSPLPSCNRFACTWETPRASAFFSLGHTCRARSSNPQCLWVNLARPAKDPRSRRSSCRTRSCPATTCVFHCWMLCTSVLALCKSWFSSTVSARISSVVVTCLSPQMSTSKDKQSTVSADTSKPLTSLNLFDACLLFWSFIWLVHTDDFLMLSDDESMEENPPMEGQSQPVQLAGVIMTTSSAGTAHDTIFLVPNS